MTPETALQAALVAALRAAPDVAAIVGNRIFDEVPAGKNAPARPLVYLGPINRRRLEVDGGAWSLTARIFVVTDGVGRVAAWELAHAVANAVDGQELTLGEPFAAADVIRASQAGDVLDPLAPKSVFVDLATTVQQVEN